MLADSRREQESKPEEQSVDLERSSQKRVDSLKNSEAVSMT